MLTLCFCSGCAGSPELVIDMASHPPTDEPWTSLTLFDGWREGPRMSFERDLSEWNPTLAAHRLDPDALQILTEALGGLDEPAMRAALLLGHSRALSAAQALLARLEARVEGPERDSDSADVVAAATLAAWPAGTRFGARLVELSTGEKPHPDLEVRVECASSALARGHTEVVPFLLRVLRASTPAQREDPPDWTPKPTMAWSKSRAATALSWHLGVSVNFRADSSYEDQLSEIARLVALLAEPVDR